MASVATPPVTDTQGMNYLVSLPRRIVTVWLPLSVFLIVLLFPFYWMVITTFKPNEELLSREGNPFWVQPPDVRAHPQAAVRDGVSGLAVEHGAGVGRVDVSVDRVQRARRVRDRAACAFAARATSA
jgi:ABC-type glycerol-3-phosphate transport system permease component